MPGRLVIVLLVEVAYALATRGWLRRHFDGIELELHTSAVRVATIALYLLLFRDLLRPAAPAQHAAARSALFAAGLLLALLVPVLVGDAALPDLRSQIVFALTSIVVGVREEIVYRGIVQNLLERRIGWTGAILLSNVAFVLYHYGARPFTVPNLVEFYAMGCLLGCIYRVTRSLWLVIAIHAEYDALSVFPPLPDPALSREWGMLMQAIALLLIAVWTGRAMRARRER